MYAIFGNPSGHSLSPELMYQLLQIKGDKIVLPELINKEKLTEILKTKNIKFANITYPYKELFYKFSDEVFFPGNKTNSVNAVIFENNRILSTNTDGEGFFLAINLIHHEIYKRLINDRYLFIAGTGSTARSIGFSCKLRGINPIFISRKKFMDLNYDYKINEIIDYNSNNQNIISYETALRFINKIKNPILFSSLPISILKMVETDNTNKIEDLDNNVINFFKLLIEKNSIIFDSNYKDYFNILSENQRNYKEKKDYPLNIIPGFDQFIGQGLLSVYFFKRKNFITRNIFLELKRNLIK